jgi:SAM-dependent methyltransferase
MSGHHHDHVHMDEREWAELADYAELEGEVMLGFVADAAQWVNEVRGADAQPVMRVIDIGSGPGVGTCELARLFPQAQVVAVDSSPAMLERVVARAEVAGLSDRVRTHRAELPNGLDGLEPADVIWASLSLHHVGDEVDALRRLGDLLADGAVLAIAEIAEPTRFVPRDVGLGRPGLAERLEAVEAEWFASMRAGLDGSVASAELTDMIAAAGLTVIGSRLAIRRFAAPLDDAAGRLVTERVRRARRQLADRLEADDLATLDVLGDPADARSAANREDSALESSRQLVLARR